MTHVAIELEHFKGMHVALYYAMDPLENYVLLDTTFVRSSNYLLLGIKQGDPLHRVIWWTYVGYGWLSNPFSEVIDPPAAVAARCLILNNPEDAKPSA